MAKHQSKLFKLISYKFSRMRSVAQSAQLSKTLSAIQQSSIGPYSSPNPSPFNLFTLFFSYLYKTNFLHRYIIFIFYRQSVKSLTQNQYSRSLKRSRDGNSIRTKEEDLYLIASGKSCFIDNKKLY